MVRLYGTNQWSNPPGVINPSWQCAVDGASVPPSPINSSVPNNGVLFCEKDGLSDGTHVITLNATVAHQQTFWFDYIEYVPTSSVSLDQVPLFIYAGDSQFHYGEGWVAALFPGGNLTGQTGSTFSFQFNGDFY